AREARHRFLQVGVRGCERRREEALVAGVAVARRLRREGDEAALERKVIDAAGDAQLRRQERSVAWVGVLDPDQVAVAAHFRDDRDVRQRLLELLAQPRTALAPALDQ